MVTRTRINKNSYDATNNIEQSDIAGEINIKSGGEIDIESGGALKIGAVAVNATAAEINGAADLSAQEMTPGVGISGGTGTVFKSKVVKQGGIIKTEILIDLTGLSSSTTDLDIIGQGVVAAYLCQITAALNGTIMYGQMRCLETPAGGVTDIDLYSATEATGVFDGAISLLTETALLTKGGAWSGAVTPAIFTGAVVANQYLYLCGGAAGTAAAYTAGRFLIELWGV